LKEEELPGHPDRQTQPRVILKNMLS
jgi:hypothetical protein